MKRKRPTRGGRLFQMDRPTPSGRRLAGMTVNDMLLGSNLAVCRVDEQLVFLDLADDSFFLLPPGQDAALIALVSGCRELGEGQRSASRPSVDPERLLTATSDGTAGLAERPAPAPRHRRFCLRAACNMAIRQWIREWDLRYRPLKRIIADVRARRQSGTTMGERHLRLMDAARDSSLIRSSHGRCLAAALALLDALAKEDFFPDLVVGVAIAPFEAHCWLEKDGVVLNDRLDHVGRFTPILIL